MGAFEKSAISPSRETLLCKHSKYSFLHLDYRTSELEILVLEKKQFCSLPGSLQTDFLPCRVSGTGVDGRGPGSELV